MLTEWMISIKTLQLFTVNSGWYDDGGDVYPRSVYFGQTAADYQISPAARYCHSSAKLPHYTTISHQVAGGRAFPCWGMAIIIMERKQACKIKTYLEVIGVISASAAVAVPASLNRNLCLRVTLDYTHKFHKCFEKWENLEFHHEKKSSSSLLKGVTLSIRPISRQGVIR